MELDRLARLSLLSESLKVQRSRRLQTSFYRSALLYWLTLITRCASNCVKLSGPSLNRARLPNGQIAALRLNM